jgi:hypothetical protein
MCAHYRGSHRLHSKAGKANMRFETAACETGLGTTLMCTYSSLGICLHAAYYFTNLLTDGVLLL